MRGERIAAAGEPCLSPIKSPQNDKSLLSDARSGNLTQMRKRMRNSIFKKPEDINQRDERNCTPLHYAAKNGHLEMIRFIVDKGGDLSATDKHGWSILQYAVRYAPLETVEFLLELGSDLSHKEKKGWNCLHLAARNGQPEKARFILEKGANINETQDQGWNSLHLAVRYGQPDTISTLLEYGIDINAVNRGWTPLHLAALNGHTDIASILLNKGAATDVTNDDGKTALDIAREEKHDRIVAIILEREFQSQNAENVLPSPPPTPPSAPPIEFSVPAVNLNGHHESFQEWQSRLRHELENVKPDQFHEEETHDDHGEQESIQFAWKTFDEEASELMNQLERLRLQEVEKVKAKIVHTKKEFGQKLLKFEKQRHLLQAQIESIKSTEFPRIEEEFVENTRICQSQISEIESQLVNLKKEIEATKKLQSGLVRGSQQFEQKFQLLDEVVSVQKSELTDIECSRMAAILKCDELRNQRESAIVLNREKVKMLQDNIDHLRRCKADLENDHQSTLSDLSQKLEKAERRSHFNHVGPDQDENWFGCPVCLLLLKPPMRIFQCPEGHILCEECKENPAMVHCPQCRCPLEGQCSRNRALEEVARSYFPMAPSGTL